MNTAVHECKECLHRRTKERLLLQPLFVIFGQFHKVFFSPPWLQLWQPSRPFGYLWLHAAVPQKTHLPKVDGKSTHVEPAVNQQMTPHTGTRSQSSLEMRGCMYLSLINSNIKGLYSFVSVIVYSVSFYKIINKSCWVDIVFNFDSSQKTVFVKWNTREVDQVSGFRDDSWLLLWIIDGANPSFWGE